MSPIIGILIQLIGLYETLIFIYVIMSWFLGAGGGALQTAYRLLGTICEPWVGLFRRIIPLQAGGLDFSPMIAILALYVIERVLLFLR